MVSMRRLFEGLVTVHMCFTCDVTAAYAFPVSRIWVDGLFSIKSINPPPFSHLSGEFYSVFRGPAAGFHTHEILGSICIQKSKATQRQRCASLLKLFGFHCWV